MAKPDSDVPPVFPAGPVEIDPSGCYTFGSAPDLIFHDRKPAPQDLPHLHYWVQHIDNPPNVAIGKFSLELVQEAHSASFQWVSLFDRKGEALGRQIYLAAPLLAKLVTSEDYTLVSSALVSASAERVWQSLVRDNLAIKHGRGYQLADPNSRK